MRLHPPAPGSDVGERGGGCHDNAPADSREDGGSGRETYITIIFFFSLGLGSGMEEGEGGQALQMSLGACCFAARCVKSIPLHLTPRPSHSLCDTEGDRGPFLCERLLSYLL